MLCYDTDKRIVLHFQGGLHCRECKNKNCHIRKPHQDLLLPDLLRAVGQGKGMLLGKMTTGNPIL